MPRRPGTYAKSIWRGVIRDGRYPIGACDHRHSTQAEARQCADEAWPIYKATGKWPLDWKDWSSHSDNPAFWEA